MVIDTSAVIAILFGEVDAGRFSEAIEADPVRLMSAASILEACLVVESELGEEGSRELDLLLLKVGIETVAFNEEQLQVARHAFREYGKGHHPAGLNYGDCFSYALSRTSGEPLLFKGNDFAKTDVTICL
ncbi:MAG: type II toxin-antitoxin system VapC family toxin [Gemmatimonadetes bacterium]|jgi:ribonuclease VapC|nr:type II toxin-antitoxin system VapC family toxin [Gemmatimonadota bacterium]MBT5591133.1 type II toxin-antitoxin system VapC family toxin [Gemmatimonadota bacterium]MBT6148356.1 type II toxin-antitoxin system VapC family toxin [Gemmatimonadota bacterium]MBT7863852.1 type II toxin-antitoxin system VapC family toxin [Gemmatimonadota bacterium]